MNVNDLFPSKYLKAHDLGGKSFTLIIRAITLEDVGHGAEKERKLTLAFEKATKMMLLNRTNAMIIASMYGPETDAWKGKAVTIYSARVKAFGSWHDALRIKEQIPARNVGAAQMTEAMTEQPPIDDEDDLLDVEEGQISDPSAPRDGPEPELVDDLWETKPRGAPGAKPNLISQAQLARLHTLGMDLYKTKAAWDKERPRLVQHVSKGAISSSKELSPDEATVLISGLEKELAKAAVANAKVAAGP